jgi:DNA excision repair protein ERCC-2
LKPYTVAVRALCEFAAIGGDLDLRFSPSSSAQEGIKGHRSVSASRGAGYRAEIALSGAYGERLVVRGRADGFDAERNVLEEVKTYRGELARMPLNQRRLHWAQAKVYGALLCRELGLQALTISLVYFEVGEQREAPPLLQHCSAAELERHFDALCARFLVWADAERAHRAARDARLAALRFPHEAFRSGQHALAKSVFNAARLGRCLLAQAPTGIGKTLATLFPLLKAGPTHALDKVFFLTAKGSGRGIALDALATIQHGEPALRVIELVAREKACEHPDKACHGESCPLATGFYDRLPAAREAAVTAATLTRETLREVALAHRVCPYHLGQELARWCDVVVGDYNHFFDNSALLHGLTLANGWKVGVLVDEAHNLVERARGMYSAELESRTLRALRGVAPEALKKPLDRLQRAWSRLAKAQTAAYAVLAEPPHAVVKTLQEASSAIAQWLAEHPAGVASELLNFYFDALAFSQRLETLAAHSLLDLTLEPGTDAGRAGESRLCVRNLVPAHFLAPRFAVAHATVLFSATLTPWHFYADVLGLPQDCAWLDVDAPFNAEQLAVTVERRVSTRYRDRAGSLVPIARLIAAQYAARPGNYLAFFSSFEYLEQAAATFRALAPQVPIWQQARRLNEAERADFLARFALDGRGIGFAVLGGSFAEGIDLTGTRLIGAFIATLGLPQVNPVNEQLRRRLEADFGDGHDYAYLFPGIRKVVQAAGRVIRTRTDVGSVHLIDDRFARPEVLRLLPRWWRVEVAAGP